MAQFDIRLADGIWDGDPVPEDAPAWCGDIGRLIKAARAAAGPDDELAAESAIVAMMAEAIAAAAADGDDAEPVVPPPPGAPGLVVAGAPTGEPAAGDEGHEAVETAADAEIVALLAPDVTDAAEAAATGAPPVTGPGHNPATHSLNGSSRKLNGTAHEVNGSRHEVKETSRDEAAGEPTEVLDAQRNEDLDARRNGVAAGEPTEVAATTEDVGTPAEPTVHEIDAADRTATAHDAFAGAEIVELAGRRAPSDLPADDPDLVALLTSENDTTAETRAIAALAALTASTGDGRGATTPTATHHADDGEEWTGVGLVRRLVAVKAVAVTTAVVVGITAAAATTGIVAKVVVDPPRGMLSEPTIVVTTTTVDDGEAGGEGRSSRSGQSRDSGAAATPALGAPALLLDCVLNFDFGCPEATGDPGVTTSSPSSTSTTASTAPPPTAPAEPPVTSTTTTPATTLETAPTSVPTTTTSTTVPETATTTDTTGPGPAPGTSPMSDATGPGQSLSHRKN
jgi:hypothetical protein